MTSRLTALRACWSWAREGIADATTVEQYDRAKRRAAYLADLILRIETRHTATA